MTSPFNNQCLNDNKEEDAQRQQQQSCILDSCSITPRYENHDIDLSLSSSSSSSPSVLDNQKEDDEEQQQRDLTKRDSGCELEEETFLSIMNRTPAMTRTLRRELHRGGKNKNNTNTNTNDTNDTNDTNRNTRNSSKPKHQRKAQRAMKEQQLLSMLEDEQISSSRRRRRQRKSKSKCNNRNSNNSNKMKNTSKSSTAVVPEYEEEGDFLTASELGIEDEDMYERLLSILEGDEISPEDYDVLLQLDTNNVRKTLDENEISCYPIIVVGDDDGDNDADGDNNPNHASKIDVSSWKCDICLESWSDLSVGTELRCLPCSHVFCKSCIDDWLSQRSQKCPTLSCFWMLEQQQT